MLQLIDKKNKIIIYLIFLFILSTISSKTLKNKETYSSSIEKIEVIGLSTDDNLEILNGLNKFLFKNIFILRKKEIERVISEYNIIEEFNIKKIYPSKLNISIKPTKLIAKIPGNKNLLIGSNGKLIVSKISNNGLPYVFGKFNSKKFLEFKKIVDQSKFNFNDLKSIFFFPSNRWDILTIDNILIKLPEKNLIKSLDFGYEILNNNEFKENKVIDLRISNQVIIQ